MSEQWKDIKGYEGYQVSNFGNVRSWRSQSGGVRENSYLLKKYDRGHGYLSVMLEYKNKKVHRLVAGAFVPNPGNKPYVNHLDGNKSNNHVSNLEWCTPAENSCHAKDSGLIPRGEAASRSKLSRRDIKEIRRHVRNSGYHYGRKELAKKYGVSETHIKRIAQGHCWGHVC